MIRANIMRYRGAGISPPELQSACLNSVVTSTKRDNLLGKPVVRALNTVNISQGFEAGLAIVLVAIILDRLCKIINHDNKVQPT